MSQTDVSKVIQLLNEKSNYLLRGGHKGADRYKKALKEYLDLYNETRMLLKKQYGSEKAINEKIELLKVIQLPAHMSPTTFWKSFRLIIFCLLFPPLIFIDLFRMIIYQNHIKSELEKISRALFEIDVMIRNQVKQT